MCQMSSDPYGPIFSSWQAATQKPDDVLFSIAYNCAITNHPLGSCRRWWHCCCGQKLTSNKLDAWISRDQERALVDVPRTMDLCQMHQSNDLIICYWACYARNKTDKNLNISADSQLICTKLSEQGSFFWGGQNESKKYYARIKTYENLNISADSQAICTQLSEQGLFFWGGQSESQEVLC